jgi:hypothetical protein
MGRWSRRVLVVSTIVMSIALLAACDESSGPPDLRKQAINACVRSDPTLDRASCSCLVDKLALTPDEVEDLDQLSERDVSDPSAEIERILGKRRAEILLPTTAECNG